MEENEMEKKESAPASTAVWYFIGATFLFSGTTLWSTTGEGRVPFLIVGMVLGFAVFGVGVWVFVKEISNRRK